jgi:hypothetical protein
MLTFDHCQATVMAGEGLPSMPLFLQKKGVDVELHRRDGRRPPKSQCQQPLVLFYSGTLMFR